MTAIFLDNKNLCNEVTERVIQHFVHCIETQGRHVPYLKFLQTVVKAEGEFIKKTQDMVMAEVHKPIYQYKICIAQIYGVFSVYYINVIFTSKDFHKEGEYNTSISFSQYKGECNLKKIPLSFSLSLSSFDISLVVS